MNFNFILSSFLKKYKQLMLSEKKVSYGNENLEKIFYVIGIDFKTEGLFAIVKSIFSHIIYAIDKGYIPVVDMQHFSSQYLRNKDINVWELFFLQPCAYSLNDISNSKNVILSKNALVPDRNYGIYVDLFNDKSRLNKLAGLYKKYIKLNAYTLEYFETKISNLNINWNDQLGVLCRGTDYLLLKPANHPIQPEPEIVIAHINDLLKQFSINHIFLATEDEDVYLKFRSKFGDRIITNGQSLCKLDNACYLSDLFSNTDANYKRALDYLFSIYVLSKCSFFIGGRTAGTIGVYLMSECFIYDYVWDLGYYPNR